MTCLEKTKVNARPKVTFRFKVVTHAKEICYLFYLQTSYKEGARLYNYEKFKFRQFKFLKKSLKGHNSKSNVY